MKVASSKILTMIIIFSTVLLTISCDKNSDLLVEYVLSDDLQNEKLEGFAKDDSSKLATDQSAVQDALANDINGLGKPKNSNQTPTNSVEFQ